MVAGTARLVEAIQAFRFDEEQVAHLRRAGVVDDAAASWLAEYRFRGDADGYAEGEIVEALQSVFGTYTESPVF